MKNTFDVERELAIQDGTEWKFGSIETDLALIPLKDRLKYCSPGEKQFNDVMDTQGCASRAPINTLKAKLNWFYENGMHPALKKWCDEQGYRPNGYFDFSEAFIEILSKTTKKGNSLKEPIHAIHEHGLIPAKYLPLEDGMTWEEYMNPARITQEMLNLGNEFKKRISVNYEQVTGTFLQELEEDFISTGVHAWSTPVDGVYPRVAQPFNHAVALVDPTVHALDNYEPFVKTLAKDYNFFLWGYSLSITNQNPFPNETIALFEVLSKHGLLKFFAEALRRFYASFDNVATQVVDGEVPRYPDDVPQETPKPEPVTMVANVNTRGHDHKWRGGTIEERKAMFALANEIGKAQELHKYKSKILPDTHTLLDDYLATIEGESGFNQWCINTQSLDYGIAQFSIKYYCKEYNMTPQECLDNPKRCLEIMATNFKSKRRENWIAFKYAKDRLVNNTVKIYV